MVGWLVGWLGSRWTITSSSSSLEGTGHVMEIRGVSTTRYTGMSTEVEGGEGNERGSGSGGAEVGERKKWEHDKTKPADGSYGNTKIIPFLYIC